MMRLPPTVEVDADGRCCCADDKCVRGRRGSQPRCTTYELLRAGCMVVYRREIHGDIQSTATESEAAE